MGFFDWFSTPKERVAKSISALATNIDIYHRELYLQAKGGRIKESDIEDLIRKRYEKSFNKIIALMKAGSIGRDSLDEGTKRQLKTIEIHFGKTGLKVKMQLSPAES